MKTGNQLKINVMADGATEPTAFNVSLKGFSAALERTRALLVG
jgi:invasion protein IalB